MTPSIFTRFVLVLGMLAGQAHPVEAPAAPANADQLRGIIVNMKAGY